jgi:lambda repressor-like predicted transcriptional regulator
MATLKQLSQAASRMEAASARRNTLILQLRDRGYSLRQIGAAAGLTHQAIKLICDANQEAATEA